MDSFLIVLRLNACWVFEKQRIWNPGISETKRC